MGAVCGRCEWAGPAGGMTGCRASHRIAWRTLQMRRKVKLKQTEALFDQFGALGGNYTCQITPVLLQPLMCL